MLLVPRRVRRWSTPITIGMALLLLAGCGVTEPPQTMFAPQGDHSLAIRNLFMPVFWLAIAVFVIVEGALIYSVVRYRRRTDSEGIPLQIHGNTPIEIAWTIIPALIVLVIAVLTFRTQAQITGPAEDPIRVTVVGHQWWWEFQYPDYDLITANELHIPANRDVELSLQSADVIHSFWVPRLAGKTDLIPGYTNKLMFRPLDEERVLIRGQCAEFCGGTHAMMGMHVAVESQAEFDAWVRQQQQKPPVPEGVAQTEGAAATEGDEAAPLGADVPVSAVEQTKDLEAQGYELFASTGCVACHAIKGYPGAVSRVGPDLSYVGSREYIVAGWLENTPENMKRWLRAPNEVKPDNVMGTVIKRGTLTEAQIEALTAYLQSLELRK
jgi:cytochrome c oxidase subunit 2